MAISQAMATSFKVQILGEDFAFCRLWRNTGGKCYCYIMDYITHVGEFQYTGRLWDEMKPSSVDTPDKSR